MKTDFSQVYQDLIDSVKSSKKYRALDLPENMLRDLLDQSAEISRNVSELKSNFRKSLHNVIAPYLESIDYDQEIQKIKDLFASQPSQAEISAYCLETMAKHASTRERLPHLEHFFNTIHAFIGEPANVLDLACALDPLCLPWIKLSAGASFKAYDINKARVRFLDTFFEHAFPYASAIQQDIFLNSPQETADCAFFFKEAHRLEKRQSGATRILLEKLNARTIIVSLPAVDLKGHHSLESYHRALIDKAIADQPWQLQSERVGNELLFFISKEPQT
jgi:16S rRNA (guanine(1405)-N(7))-methyltransferase